MKETAREDSGHTERAHTSWTAHFLLGTRRKASRWRESLHPNIQASRSKVQVAAYAFAVAISVSRVTARQHFPSDVLVGGTLGYLIGGYVVRHHSAESVASGFSFVPVVDVSTLTFGANVALRPDQLDMAKVGRLMIRIRLK